MRKGLVVISVIVVILSIASFLPITQKTDISISASFDNTVLQIMHLENWKNWYPSMRGGYSNNPANYSFAEDTLQKIYTIITADKKYIIHAITPMSYQIIEEKGTQVGVFAFTVFPSDTVGKMKITIIKKNPLLFVIFNKNKVGETAINGLKSYLEDPKTFYGFDIERGKIRDSIMASSIFRVRKKDLFLKIHEAYLNLLQYINANDLKVTDHICVSYIPISDDSLRITVGVPVNKVAPSSREINCLMLPAKGKVVAGSYEGIFSERQKLYLAISKYLIDQSLSSVAECFERYLNDSIPSSDSSIIKIELNNPVY